MVFLTIAATVCIQGSWASWLARALKVRAVRPRGILLVGVNEWSLAVAETAESLDLHVKLLDTNPALCEAARQRGFDAIEGDGTSVETYERVDLSHIGALVAMTPNDAVNTLACEAAAPWLDEGHVYQIVSKPAGNGARSPVRLAGRRAMPSASSHSAISFLLQQKQLRTVHVTCKTATPIEGEVLTEEGRMLPLFVVEGDRCRPALEGLVCPEGGILVGLVGWPTRSPAPQVVAPTCGSLQAGNAFI
jgi:Trk K+ transport system NAD-binding subunit